MEQRAQLAGLIESRSLRGGLGAILRVWKFRGILAASAVAYWLVYSFSSGMLRYYPFDVTPLLEGVRFYRIALGGGLYGLYNSGIVWFPNGHLEVVLLYGTAFFSLLLSTLFGLSIALFVHGPRNSTLERTSGSIGSKDLSPSLLGLLPALFTGGCCSLPFGTLILSFLSSPVLSFFVYDYSIITNPAVAIVMLVSVVYTVKRTSNYRQCSYDQSAQHGP